MFLFWLLLPDKLNLLYLRKEAIRNISTVNLSKRKVCARFVLHALTDEQKLATVQHCQDIIKTTRKNQKFNSKKPWRIQKIYTGGTLFIFQ